MEKSRLLRLLRTLSPAELRALKKYVRTPFFNQRTEVPALLDVLLQSLKSGSAPSKASAHRQVFQQEEHNDHRLRLAMTFLYQITLQFLAVQDFLNDAPRYRARLAGLLRHRDLPDQAVLAQTDAKVALYRQPLRNADFFEEDYQLRLEQYRFNHSHHSSSIEPTQLQSLSDSLDYAFLARKLWQACFLHSHQAMSGASYDQGLLAVALEQAAQPKAMAVPAIAIYFHCYHALTEPDTPAHFQAFKQLVLTRGDLFPPDEMRDLYVLAVNFCIRQYNAGNPAYLAEQFDFYREGLAKKYFLTEGALSRYTYLNAATSALALHELDWAERFIHEHRDLLAEGHREALFSFNLARLEYQRRRLGPALRLLQKADYRDVPLHLAAKMLQLKIYYETGEYDLLESHLQALRAFLRRRKSMGYHRENYLNTLHFAQKLLEINPIDKEARLSLRQEIESSKGVAEKEWLLAQM